MSTECSRTAALPRWWHRKLELPYKHWPHLPLSAFLKTQAVWVNSIRKPYANSWMKIHCLFPIPYCFSVAFPLPTVFSPGWFPELDVLFLSSSMSQTPFQACVCSSTAPQLFLNVSRVWLVQIGTVWPAVWGNAVHVGSEVASDGFIF